MEDLPGAAGAPQAEPAPRAFALPLHSAWLTNVILVINIIIFILLTLASTLLTSQNLIDAVWNGAVLGVLELFGAKSNPLIKQGEYWRLLTPIFLHIGLLHLLFNQYALSIFGREVERLFGTLRFATIYLLSGLFGSAASFALSPALSAGASGAIFGVIGAMVAFFLRNREDLGEMGRNQLRSLGGMILINLLLGVTIPGIDNWGHLGGLASGFLLGLLLAPTYRLRRLPSPPYAHVVEEPSRVPTGLVLLGGGVLLIALVLLALPFAPPS